jgi:hypothetical protein
MTNVRLEMEIPKDGVKRRVILEWLIPQCEPNEQHSFRTAYITPQDLEDLIKPPSQITFVMWHLTLPGVIMKRWDIFLTPIEGEDLDMSFVWQAPVRKTVHA